MFRSAYILTQEAVWYRAMIASENESTMLISWRDGKGKLQSDTISKSHIVSIRYFRE